jgi:hypothetical protein
MIGVSQVKTIISETGITTVQDFTLLRHDLDWTRTWYVTERDRLPKEERRVRWGLRR